MFYIDEAKPEDFEITSPDSGDSFEAGSSVTLKWSKSKNSDYYEVNVRDLTTNELVIDGKETTSRSYEISSKKLEAGHKYRASVTAYSDSYDKGRSGGECTFTIKEKVVEVKKPEDFDITAPTSGSSYEAGSSVTMKWTTSKNSDYYKVNVRDLTTNQLIVEGKKVTGTSYVVSAGILPAGHEYRASVTAYSNELAEGRSGGECTFTIKEKVVEVKKPEDFNITAPTSGSSYEAGSSVTLKWTTSKNSDYYKVNVRDLTTHQLIVEGKKVTGTSYVMSAGVLLDGHEYRASVTAYSNELAEGRSGGECTFTIKEKVVEVKKPEDFNITAPTSGSSYEAGSSVTLKWTTSKNSDYYKVNVRDLTTNQLIVEGKKVTGTSYVMSAGILPDGHEYRASVTAYSNELEEGRSGGECTFTIKEKVVEVKKPEDFDITAPEWGESFEEESDVTIRWTISKNSDYYVVSVRDLDTNKLIVDGKRVKNRSYTIEADWLTAGHEYRASVTAYSNELEEGRSGGECNFIIAEKEVPEVMEPEVMETEVIDVLGEFEITNNSASYEPGSTVTIQWTASENAKYYFVYIINMNTGEVVAAGKEVSELYYQISAEDLLEGNYYSAFVGACDEDYTDTYFCEEYYFEIAYKEPEPLFNGTLGEITFANKYEEKLGSNAPLLSWNSNLTEAQKNAVKYTVIQVYRKNPDGTSVLVHDQQVNSHCTQQKITLVGGLYGIEVSYYDETYNRVATGQTRIKMPGTIDGFKIDNVTEGKGAVLQGVINTSSPIEKILCSVTDNKTKKREIMVELKIGGNVQIYSLAGSEFDSKVPIEKLKAGTKTVALAVCDSNGEFLFTETNLTIYEKKAKITPVPSYNGISSDTMGEINKNIAGFDYRLFVANKEVTPDGYYTVDGKLYHAFCYQGGVVYFVDYAQQKIVAEEELLQKLIFTRNVSKSFESKKVLVDGVYTEQNETLLALDKATQEHKRIWGDIAQVAVTKNYVEAVGVAIPSIGTSGATLKSSYTTYAFDKARDAETYLLAFEMSMASYCLYQLEKANTMAQNGNIKSYENAFEMVRVVSTTEPILEELKKSALDTLDYSDVDSEWKKAGWWLTTTWDGILTGFGVQSDKVTEFAKEGMDGFKNEAEYLQLMTDLKAYGFLVQSSGVMVEGLALGEVDLSEGLIFVAQEVLKDNKAVQVATEFAKPLDALLEKELAAEGGGWFGLFLDSYRFDVTNTWYHRENYIQTYALLDDIMSNAEPYLTTTRATLAKGESATIDIYREKNGVKAEYTSADQKTVKVDKNGKVTVLRDDAKEVKITVKITQDGKVYQREFIVEIVK